MTFLLQALFAAAGILLTFALLRRSRKAHNIPGPPGYPLIGNMLDIPRSNQQFADLRDKYGDVVCFSVLNQGIVILNSQKAAMEILGTKGETSAGRPILTMVSELSGYDRFLALHQNDEKLREGRKYLYQAIGPQHARDYAPALEAEVVRYLKKLSNGPEDFEAHCRWIVGTCLLLITYGHITSDHTDPYIEGVSLVMQQFSEAAALGWMVDLIPPLKHIPNWFPGARFKKLAALYRSSAQIAFEKPFLSVKQQMREGVARKSLLASYLEESPHLTKKEQDSIMFLMGDLNGAGLHTVCAIDRLIP